MHVFLEGFFSFFFDSKTLHPRAAVFLYTVASEGETLPRTLLVFLEGLSDYFKILYVLLIYVCIVFHYSSRYRWVHTSPLCLK